MPLNQLQQDNIMTYLRETAEADGVELDANNFEQYFFGEWDTITDSAKMRHKHKRRELRQLRIHRARLDDTATQMDADIAQLESDLPAGAVRAP